MLVAYIMACIKYNVPAIPEHCRSHSGTQRQCHRCHKLDMRDLLSRKNWTLQGNLWMTKALMLQPVMFFSLEIFTSCFVSYTVYDFFYQFSSYMTISLSWLIIIKTRRARRATLVHHMIVLLKLVASFGMVTWSTTGKNRVGCHQTVTYLLVAQLWYRLRNYSNTGQTNIAYHRPQHKWPTLFLTPSPCSPTQILTVIPLWLTQTRMTKSR